MLEKQFGQEIDSLIINQNKKVKNNWYKSFLQIMPFINLSKRKNLLKIKADQFIKTKNYDLLIEMLENGYQTNEKQVKAIQQYMEHSVFAFFMDWEDLKYTDKLISLGIPLANEAIKSFLTTLTSQCLIPAIYVDLKLDYSLKDIRENSIEKIYENQYPYFIGIIKNRIEEKNFFKDYYDKLERDIYIDKRTDIAATQLIYILTNDYNAKLFLQDVSYDRLIKFQIKLGKSNIHDSNTIVKLINNRLRTEYEEDIKNVIELTKEMNNNEYIKNLTLQSIQEFTTKINTNDISVEASKIMDNISILYKNIKLQVSKEVDVNTVEMGHSLNILYEKRLPEILQKYLTIDESYRKTLTNAEGKNAEILMIESLENIESNFQQKWQELNQLKVSALSATNKYTKNFK